MYATCRRVLAGLVLLAMSGAASAGFVFVGSWAVNDGPFWGDNPQVYTGQEAAALLFGGVASDYAISTVSDQVADINFSAWLDGWGDPDTYGPTGAPAAHDFSLDLSGEGYNGCAPPDVVIPCFQSAYSAYVSDHSMTARNFAFQITPEPASTVLMGLGLLGVVAVARAQRRRAR